MTYLQFLVYFVILPAVALSVLVRPTRREWLSVLAVMAIAYLWTTPWDNYLVGSGVWYYNPALVTGIVFGWVPLEEYLFFGLQVWLAGMWTLALMRLTGYAANAPQTITVPALAVSALLGLGVWALSQEAANPQVLPALLGAFRTGPMPADLPPLPFGTANYALLIGVWAAPVILGQLWLAWPVVRQHPALWALGWLAPAAYLTALDALAIGSGTWTIAPTQSLGVMLPGGVVPLEEGLFFVATCILITQGLILFTHASIPGRIAALFGRQPAPQPAGD